MQTPRSSSGRRNRFLQTLIWSLCSDPALTRNSRGSSQARGSPGLLAAQTPVFWTSSPTDRPKKTSPLVAFSSAKVTATEFTESRPINSLSTKFLSSRSTSVSNSPTPIVCLRSGRFGSLYAKKAWPARDNARYGSKSTSASEDVLAARPVRPRPRGRR